MVRFTVSFCFFWVFWEGDLIIFFECWFLFALIAVRLSVGIRLLCSHLSSECISGAFTFGECLMAFNGWFNEYSSIACRMAWQQEHAVHLRCLTAVIQAAMCVGTSSLQKVTGGALGDLAKIFGRSSMV